MLFYFAVVSRSFSSPGAAPNWFFFLFYPSFLLFWSLSGFSFFPTVPLLLSLSSSPLPSVSSRQLVPLHLEVCENSGSTKPSEKERRRYCALSEVAKDMSLCRGIFVQAIFPVFLLFVSSSSPLIFPRHCIPM